MAGRPQGMARKATELEGEVLQWFRRLDSAIPDTHKRSGRGQPAAPSPWTKLHRASCALVVAARDVGQHCRQAAGLESVPGPIEADLADAIPGLRAVAGSGSVLTPGVRLEPGVTDNLPGSAAIREEIEWVAANLHQDEPDPTTAPSKAAFNMLVDVRADSAVRRDFWNIVWSKRLSPGERKLKTSAFPEDTQSESDIEADEHQNEVLRRLFGDLKGK